MHWSLKCVGITFGLLVILIAFIVIIRFSCDGAWKNDYAEVSRLTSPDLRVDAVTMIDTLRTDQRLLKVYIEKKGEKVRNPEGVDFAADKVYGFHVRWANSHVLEIHYQKARIFRFSNIWTPGDMVFKSDSTPPAFYTIEIKLLKDGDDDLDILHE